MNGCPQTSIGPSMMTSAPKGCRDESGADGSALLRAPSGMLKSGLGWRINPIPAWISSVGVTGWS